MRARHSFSTTTTHRRVLLRFSEAPVTRKPYARIRRAKMYSEYNKPKNRKRMKPHAEITMPSTNKTSSKFVVKFIRSLLAMQGRLLPASNHREGRERRTLATCQALNQPYSFRSSNVKKVKIRLPVNSSGKRFYQPASIS